MALQSKLFAGDSKLEAAAVSDPAHIVPGASGPHVGKIQKALVRLDDLTISTEELDATHYGTSTAKAVLSYKTKRSIINRSYQSSADNIVGKMTMARLDRDVAAVELIVTTPVIVPIDPPPRPVKPGFLVEAQRSNMQRAATAGFALAPVSSQLAPTSLGLFDKVPSFPSAQIEIDSGDVAKFLIIGGKGERVFVENFRIGLLIDPEDALREKVLLDITSDSQSFQVKGKTPGSTHILATKREGVFGAAGTVTMALVVNEKTVRKLWQPRLVPFREPPRKRSPFMLSPELGEGVLLSTEMFKFDGFVDPAPEIDVRDFEIGFVQTLTESMMEAVYTDDAGGQRRIFESTVQRVPVRDSKDAIPWTGPDAVKDLAVSKTVHFEDRPSNVVPWQSADKRVTLRSSSGADKFMLFFIARHKRTSVVTVLARVPWQTSWEYAFNFTNNKLATPVGQDGSLGDEVIAPVGGVQPILGGDTALNTLKADFRR